MRSRRSHRTWSHVHVLAISMRWAYATQVIYKSSNKCMESLRTWLESWSSREGFLRRDILQTMCTLCFNFGDVLGGISFLRVSFVASILQCKLSRVIEFSMKCTWTSPRVVVISAVTMNVVLEVSPHCVKRVRRAEYPLVKLLYAAAW